MSFDHFHDDTFEAQLSAFLLEAYVVGINPAGTWHFACEDDLVPDVLVATERTDGPVATSPPERRRTRSSVFATELRSMLLEAFGEGADIEGTWHVEFPRRGLPEWSVRIDLDGPGDDDRPRPADESSRLKLH